MLVIQNLMAAAGCEVFPTLSGRCVETPGRFALCFVPDRCFKPKDGKFATGQTLVVASHIRRRPRGIPVLSDLFNPLGLGNSLPSHSPSSDAYNLVLLHVKSGDMHHGSRHSVHFTD